MPLVTNTGSVVWVSHTLNLLQILFPVSINGNWGEWSNISSCDVTCGSGQSVRARQCDKPAPSNGGQECVGNAMIVSTCVLSDCDSDGSSSGFGDNYKNVRINQITFGHSR